MRVLVILGVLAIAAPVTAAPDHAAAMQAIEGALSKRDGTALADSFANDGALSVRPASYEVIVAHVAIASKIGGKTVKTPYRLLLAFESGEGDDGDARISELLVAHFSIATK